MQGPGITGITCHVLRRPSKCISPYRPLHPPPSRSRCPLASCWVSRQTSTSRCGQRRGGGEGRQRGGREGVEGDGGEVSRQTSTGRVGPGRGCWVSRQTSRLWEGGGQEPRLVAGVGTESQAGGAWAGMREVIHRSQHKVHTYPHTSTHIPHFPSPRLLTRTLSRLTSATSSSTPPSACSSSPSACLARLRRSTASSTPSGTITSTTTRWGRGGGGEQVHWEAGQAHWAGEGEGRPHLCLALCSS